LGDGGSFDGSFDYCSFVVVTLVMFVVWLWKDSWYCGHCGPCYGRYHHQHHHQPQEAFHVEIDKFLHCDTVHGFAQKSDTPWYENVD